MKENKLLLIPLAIFLIMPILLFFSLIYDTTKELPSSEVIQEHSEK